ncbi:hypothetical protein [Demequina sp. NBRC 110057]|nr:hypothetical protein [Demequina sp. NBRC 110057]
MITTDIFQGFDARRVAAPSGKASRKPIRGFRGAPRAPFAA